MKNNITPENNKGERHGYWKMYFNGNLLYKCFYQNDKEVGYQETYYSFCKKERIYHL